MKQLALFCIAIVCFSCNKQPANSNTRVDIELDYLNCYYNYLDSIKLLPVYNEVLQLFSDSLSSWMVAGLEPSGNFAGDDYTIADEVFFNEDYTKCLILISCISKDSSDKYDMVKICAGESINNSWWFYYRSYPVEYYFREYNSNKPYKKDEILRMTTRDICVDGFVILKSCKINYKYVSSDLWFQDWMRDKHREFWEFEY